VPEFLPEKFYLGNLTRNREMGFSPASLRLVKQAIPCRDPLTMSFTHATRPKSELRFGRRPFDGFNQFGRKANANIISVEVKEDYFVSEEQLRRVERLLAFSVQMYELCSPFFASIHQSRDWSLITPKPSGLPDEDEHIPCIYWSTFLGQEFVGQIGLQRVLSSPCGKARRMNDGGVLLVISESPLSPERPENRPTQMAVIEHLGLVHQLNNLCLSRMRTKKQFIEDYGRARWFTPKPFNPDIPDVPWLELVDLAAADHGG